jgi:hypothetical protein
MEQYRKKPVVICATQLINSEFRSLDDIPLSDCKNWKTGWDEQGFYVTIPTLEGDMKARNNDWIIQGVNKEYYPCKPDIFEKTYNKVELQATQDFGQALAWLKVGKKVAREGWNGSGMFVYYVPANSYPATTDIAKEEFGGKLVPYRPYLALKTAQNDIATWNPSTSDCLAEDWFVVE